MDFYEYEELLEEENRQTLQHHGILGMKWGRRNGPPWPIPKGEHSAEEVRKNPGIERNAPDPPKKRRVRDMSDKELREKTERLRLENEFTRQSYEQIRLAQGPQIDKGKTFLQKAADLSKSVNTIAVNTNSILKVFTGKDIATILGKKAGLDVDKAKETAKSDAVQQLKNDILKDLNKSLKKETEKRTKKENEESAKEDNKKPSREEKKKARAEAKAEEQNVSTSESKSEERSYWDAADARRNPSGNSEFRTETYKQSGRDEYKYTEKSPLSELGSSFIGQMVDTSTDYASYVQEHEVRVDLDSAQDWLEKIGAY